MDVSSVVLTAYQSNCYLVSQGDTLVVIDPGDYGEPLKKALGEREPTAVVCTHAHPDHVAGVPGVLERYGVPFYLHPEGRMFLERFAPEVSAFEPLSDGQTLTLGDLAFTVMHTPGHSPDGVILIEAQQRAIFVGDLVFAGSVGRVDLPGSDPEVMQQSLYSLLELADDFTLYPGHGPATTLGHERRNNPFLQALPT